MKIAILGATGMAGSRIVTEALDRGHDVTGAARDVSTLAARERLTKLRLDVTADAAAALLQGNDVLVSAMHFTTVPGPLVIALAKASGIPRLVVVGGAGSLEVSPGLQLVDSPEFPAQWKAGASAGRDFLTLLRGERALDWTFISPSALFRPGTRTGAFRVGGDALLVDETGTSSISAEDYAIALLDEVERPQHRQQRFTVGY